MQRIEFAGILETSNREAVESAMSRWLGTDLRMEDEYGAFEKSYEDDSLYVYCHEAPLGDDTFYLLEGSIDGPITNSVARLRSLATICRESGLDHEIDYTEVDSAGKSLSEEKTIQIS
ncbi:hypothetical protein [Nocardia sp. NPDC052566]|uniref:hypothetical protein n=1 Tax=Nocardia sp. NPDC052566 TaxID=3364330 RepID=UPI0037CA2536